MFKYIISFFLFFIPFTQYSNAEIVDNQTQKDYIQKHIYCFENIATVKNSYNNSGDFKKAYNDLRALYSIIPTTVEQKINTLQNIKEKTEYIINNNPNNIKTNTILETCNGTINATTGTLVVPRNVDKALQNILDSINNINLSCNKETGLLNCLKIYNVAYSDGKNKMLSLKQIRTLLFEDGILPQNSELIISINKELAELYNKTFTELQAQEEPFLKQKENGINISNDLFVFYTNIVELLSDAETILRTHFAYLEDSNAKITLKTEMDKIKRNLVIYQGKLNNVFAEETDVKYSGIINGMCYFLDLATGNISRAIACIFIILVGFSMLGGNSQSANFKSFISFCFAIALIYGSINLANLISGNKYSCKAIGYLGSGNSSNNGINTSTVKCIDTPIGDNVKSWDKTSGVYGTKSVATCNTGYSGTLAANCTLSNTWAYSGACSLIKAGDPYLENTNNFVNEIPGVGGEADTYGAIASTTCKEGYEIKNGENKIQATVNESGKWGYSSECVRKSCGEPTENIAKVSYWQKGTDLNNLNSEREGVCETGYDGYIKIKCSQNGWEVIEGSCSKNCNLPVLDIGQNTELKYMYNGILFKGDLSTKDCSLNTGFCKNEKINLLSNQSGYFLAKNDTKVALTCKEGYKYSSDAKDGENDIAYYTQCVGTEDEPYWNLYPNDFSCTILKCNNSDINFAYAQATNLTGKTNFNEILNLICDDGYKGSPKTKCTLNDTEKVVNWVNDNETSCTVACNNSSLVELENGTWQDTEQTILKNGICNTGYTASNNITATCRTKCNGCSQQNPMWIYNNETCLPNPCDNTTIKTYKNNNSTALAQIVIGSEDFIGSGENRQYQCNTGYTGVITLSCTAGQITGYFGSCTPNPCQNIDANNYVKSLGRSNPIWYTTISGNNQITTTSGTTNSNNTLYYDCGSGYTTNRRGTAICNLGNWSYTDPSCTMNTFTVEYFSPRDTSLKTTKTFNYGEQFTCSNSTFLDVDESVRKLCKYNGIVFAYEDDGETYTANSADLSATKTGYCHIAYAKKDVSASANNINLEFTDKTNSYAGQFYTSQNGYGLLTTNGTYTIGCNSGYSGSPTIKCNINGKWTISGTCGLAAGFKEFNYTGSAQNFTIPSGVTEIKMQVWGASASNSKGGYSYGTKAVSGNQTLYVYVGGMGTNTGGGWNGGGNYSSGGLNCTGGGGATDIRTSSSTSSRIIVAGGAGGNGNSWDIYMGDLLNYGSSGGGGNQTPQLYSNDGFSNISCENNGTNSGQGGNAGASFIYGGGSADSGGGGGGYVGGCGGKSGTGGAGGTGYIGGLSNAGGSAGARTGNGFARICWGGHTKCN